MRPRPEVPSVNAKPAARRPDSAGLHAHPARARGARHPGAPGAQPRPHRGARGDCRIRASPRWSSRSRSCDHRVSRTWSPVEPPECGDQLRAAARRATTPACRCCPAYHTDLSQNEPLYRAYRAISEREAPSSVRSSARVDRAHAARFPARRRRPRRRAQAALQGCDAGALAAAVEVRGERPRCHQCLDAIT